MALNLASSKSGTGLYDVDNGWTAYVGGSVVGYSVKVTVEDIDYVVTKSDSESDVLVTKNTTTIASSIASAKEVVNSLANTYLTSAYNANSGNTETVSLKASEIGVDIPSEMDNNSWIYYNYDENATPKVSATEYSLKFTVGETNYTNTIVVNLKNSQVALDTTTNTLLAQTVPSEYSNVVTVYYDPVNNIMNCNNYHEDNSKPGYDGVVTGATKTTDNQTSCLKWYQYSGNNMILDHNTHIGTKWNSSGSNTSGPSTEFLNNLSYSGWSDTLVRSDTYDGYNGETKKFTIDYSGKKARLITAQEVADITNASNATTDTPAGIAWNERTATTSDYYYFGSLNTTAYSSQTAAQKSKQESYGWLFDNLYGCNSYGCKHNDSANSSGNYGYWTSSPVGDYRAWSVSGVGTLDILNVHYTYGGVRPVITVLASDISS